MPEMIAVEIAHYIRASADNGIPPELTDSQTIELAVSVLKQAEELERLRTLIRRWAVLNYPQDEIRREAKKLV